MKTYTEEEIKAYFDYIIKKYANAPVAERTELMKIRMFDTTYGKSDTLEEVTKKLKEKKAE